MVERKKVVAGVDYEEMSGEELLQMIGKVNKAARELGIEPSMILFVATFGPKGPAIVEKTVKRLLKAHREKAPRKR